MEAYVLEWLGFLGRGFHLVAGIAWIGASFYFIWLDSHLRPPRYADEAARLGIGGEVWALHGGGFYRAQKFAVAPPELPEPLHWFDRWVRWTSGILRWLRRFSVPNVDIGSPKRCLPMPASGSMSVRGAKRSSVHWLGIAAFFAHTAMCHVPPSRWPAGTD